MDTLLLGCILYFSLRHGSSGAAPRPELRVPRAIRFALGAAVIVVMFFFAYDHDPEPRMRLAYPGLAVASALLVLLAVRRQEWIFPNLGALRVGDLLEHIGLRSYSMYLANSIMILLNKAIWVRLLPYLSDPKPQHHWLGMVATATVLTVIASELSYRFLEKVPLAWLARRTAARDARRAAASSSTVQ